MKIGILVFFLAFISLLALLSPEKKVADSGYQIMGISEGYLKTCNAIPENGQNENDANAWLLTKYDNCELSTLKKASIEATKITCFNNITKREYPREFLVFKSSNECESARKWFKNSKLTKL